MPTTQAFEEAITAFRLLFTMVFIDLDAAKVVAKGDVAARLRMLADRAEQEALPHRGSSRLDLRILRQIADGIDQSDSNKGVEGWTPVVHSNSDR